MNTPTSMLPFRLRNVVSSKSVTVAVLLLSSGNVDLNPGQPTNIKASKTKPSASFMIFGSLNVRSAVNKASQMHDIVNYFNLDIFPLQETRISSNVPSTIEGNLRPISLPVTTRVHTFTVRQHHVVVAWHLFIANLSSLSRI